MANFIRNTQVKAMSVGPIFRMEPIISAVMDVARPLWRLWYPA